MILPYIKSVFRTFCEVVIFDKPEVLLLVRKIPSLTYVLILITYNRNLTFLTYLFV